MTKVQCKLCDHTAHILITHINTVHKGVDSYRKKHPQAPLWSALGEQKLMAKLPPAHAVSRSREVVSLASLIDQDHPLLQLTGDIARFEHATPLTPQPQGVYIWPIQQLVDVITILAKPVRNRVYIKGFSGTGKTQFVHRLAALFNQSLYEWNADAFQQRATLVGQWTVRDGQTIWQDGILPQAMKSGGWLLINEIDTIDPATLNVIKPVLEDPSRLVLLENAGEVVTAHPDFRVIATANTWARGDDTGLFTNTNVQSDADVRRWHARITIDYLAAEDEITAITKLFPSVSAQDAERFVQVASKTRASFAQGRIDKTFSFAELMNWVENTYTLKTSVLRAASLSFMDSCSPDVITSITETINAIFGDAATKELKVTK